ncbi:hypothetical protein RP20_CCG002152 [Aedes albopictus]|nr:hypothetical protein RP20_CCG002152 [Aedes albopictus]
MNLFENKYFLLVSVDKLTAKGFKVKFRKDGCSICDASGKVVVTGEQSGSLYKLKLAEVERKVNLNRDLAVIPKVAERKSKQVLDLVHTDLCEPMRTTTPGGKRFLMTMIDDFSRYTVVYLLRRKSEAAGRIKEYMRNVENLFGRQPKVIRSDGGGEYVNNELHRFFADQGIRAQYTTAYTPQQNGVAERKNRSLQEMATTMLLDAGLDKRYWGEACVAAAYEEEDYFDMDDAGADTDPLEMKEENRIASPQERPGEAQRSRRSNREVPPGH